MQLYHLTIPHGRVTDTYILDKISIETLNTLFEHPIDEEDYNYLVENGFLLSRYERDNHHVIGSSIPRLTEIHFDNNICKIS